MSETTALGAAIVAGMAEGVKVWDLLNTPKLISDSFYPSISQDERDMRYRRWKMAVDRSLDWKEDLEEQEELETRRNNKMRAAIGPAIFLIVSFATVIFANRYSS